MRLMICDYCGHEIGPGEEVATMALENFHTKSASPAVGHFHKDGCGEIVAEGIVLMVDVGMQLEAIPVASPQRIGALRRKHRKPDDG